MSQNSLSKKLKKIPFKKAKTASAEPPKKSDWWALLVFPAWVTASFLGAQLVLYFITVLIQASHIELSQFGSVTVIETIFAALIYLFSFAIAFGVPYLIGRRRVTLKTLGLTRLMSWSDIGLAPLAAIAYLILTTLITLGVTDCILSFQADQTQDVGFKSLSNQMGYILAFTTLVVIAPLAEETLFRGYLYGKMRAHVPFWAAALVTSILFGIVHWQWNVSVDVFALSLVLCGLRELTGSIWAGVLVHMLKNGLAFYILFFSPFLGLGS